MRFRSTSVAPQGRNKYGNYLSKGNITRVVNISNNNGNSNQGDGNVSGGNDNNDNPNEPELGGFVLFLSKTSVVFEGMDVTAQNVSDTIDIVGYSKTLRAPTLIADIERDIPINPETGAYTEQEPAHTNYDIKGLVDGMSVAVAGNGTNDAKLTISIAKGTEFAKNTGTLSIPVSIYLGEQDLSFTNDAEMYASYRDKKKSTVFMWLEYQWEVTQVSSTAYRLDLSNENASINCDKDGNILPEAVRPTCKATLFHGIEEEKNVTYSIVPRATQNPQGISIDTTTGDITFGSNFSFDGTPLEIAVSATVKTKKVSTAVMTIAKAFPGADGTPAVSKWLVPSVNSVKYNPNTKEVIPSSLSVTCWKQEGGNAPVQTTETIYWGYDTTNPNTVYSSAITNINISNNYIAFALKSGGKVYEIETVPILVNGTNGKDGTDGKDGKNGESVYRLDLNNQNASINCDKDGNILSGAVLPTATAKLYYGMSEQSGAIYSISPAVNGVSIDSSTGVITFANSFTFGGNTSVEIFVHGAYDGATRGSAVMTVSQLKEGTDGKPAVNYWLNLSADAVHVNKGGTANPTKITAEAYKQIGDATPILAAEAVIKYGFNTVNPTTSYPSAAVTVNTSYDYITFSLLVNNIERDRETVPILKDGADGVGQQGLKGASVRGPVDYYGVTVTRRFCNGTPNASYPEDALWIDVIVKDGNYYYCNTSYNGIGTTADWNTNKDKWTLANEKFEFIATDLLLAENGKINFLTGQQITLTDTDGNITGGAMGGDGVNFWAGSSEPSQGAFRVNADGSIYASKGTFDGYVRTNFAYVNSNTCTLQNDGTYLANKGYTNLMASEMMGSVLTVVLPTITQEMNGIVYTFANFQVPSSTEVGSFFKVRIQDTEDGYKQPFMRGFRNWSMPIHYPNPSLRQSLFRYQENYELNILTSIVRVMAVYGYGYFVLDTMDDERNSLPPVAYIVPSASYFTWDGLTWTVKGVTLPNPVDTKDCVKTTSGITLDSNNEWLIGIQGSTSKYSTGCYGPSVTKKDGIMYITLS